MKSARTHYEEFAVMTDAERVARLEGMSGRELCGLMHYAEGREDGPARDQVMGFVIVEAGERHLSRVSRKASKKAKRTL